MKKVKKLVALVLSIAIIMCSTLPSLATGNDVEQTITSKIVEQLKEDLGEEKATEILNSDSESLSGKTESSTSMDSNNGNDGYNEENKDNIAPWILVGILVFIVMILIGFIIYINPCKKRTKRANELIDDNYTYEEGINQS